MTCVCLSFIERLRSDRGNGAARRGTRPHRAGRHPGRDAAQLPRLRDVGHRRPGAAGRAGRAQAGAHPHPLRDVRRRVPAGARVLQVLPGHRRRHGQLPPAWRRRDLRLAGADGPAVVDADAAGRRAGQLRLTGQRPARRHAVHRVPPGPAGDGDAAGHQRGDRRLPAELRRPVRGARGPAGPVPQPAGQRLRGHRRRDGHQDPAAQPAGSGGRRPLVPGQLRAVRGAARRAG